MGIWDVDDKISDIVKRSPAMYWNYYNFKNYIGGAISMRTAIILGGMVVTTVLIAVGAFRILG